MKDLLFWEAFDTIILLIELILVLAFVFSLNVFLRYKMILFLTFLLVVSSYNILIIPFHYYHFFLPRTWIYDNKLIFLGLFVLILLLLVKDLGSILKFIKNSFFFYYFLVGLLSIVSFSLSFINDWSSVDRYMNLFRYITNILLLLLSTWVFLTVSNQNFNFYRKVFHLVIVLLLLNVISLFFVPDQYLWIKWGVRVKVFDQSDPVLAWGLLILIVTNFINLRKNIVSSLILMYVTYGSAFKNILELTAAVPLGVFFLKLRQMPKIYFMFYLFSYVLAVVLSIVLIGNLQLEHSIVTRYYQIINFITYLKNNFYFIFVGFGPEKSFYTYVQYPVDPGAWSLIEKNCLYKSALQVPFLSDLRNLGLLGISLKFLIIFNLIRRVTEKVNFFYWEAFLLSYVSIMLVGSIVPWSPKISIYIGLFLSILLRSCEKIRRI